MNQLFYTIIVRRRRTDILYVGESSLNEGEQGVGETNSRRNDRLPFEFLKFQPQNRGYFFLLRGKLKLAITSKSFKGKADENVDFSEASRIGTLFFFSGTPNKMKWPWERKIFITAAKIMSIPFFDFDMLSYV